jgi:hypothetical protein
VVTNSGRRAIQSGVKNPGRRREAGTERSMVWGPGLRKTLNVVDGKLLAPPAGGALYYIANREKGV